MTLGVDVSHWQDNPETPQVIDFAKMKAEGVDFAFIKSSQATWMDSRFVSSWENSRLAGLPRGAYHYVDWRGTTAIQQADYFCDLFDQYGPGELPPVVDYESRYLVPGAGTARLFLKTFLERVGNRTGQTPIIYTAPYYWLEFGSADVYWRKYPLWIAHYGVDTPTVPAPWTKQHFWQFTDRGDGVRYGVESKQIDMNLWNGTLAELQEFAGFGNPDPDPEPCVFPFDVKSTVRLNVRVQPNTSAQIIPPTLPVGASLTIQQAYRDDANNIWARIPAGFICMYWAAQSKFYTEFRDFDNLQIDPIPVVVPTEMYFRLAHDTENPRWNFKARQLAPDWQHSRKVGYPQTFPIRGGNGIVELSPAFVNFFDNINTAAAQSYIRQTDMGWFNKGYFPQVKQLSWGGNVVKIDRIEGDKAYLADVYYNDEAPPDTRFPANDWYNTNVIHYFSVVYPDGHFSGPPVGPVRTFIIARNRSEKLWVPADQIIRVAGPALFFPA